MTIRGEQFANICLLRLFTGTSPLNISHKEPTATPLLQLVGRPVRVGLGLVEKKNCLAPQQSQISHCYLDEEEQGRERRRDWAIAERRWGVIAPASGKYL